MKTKNYTIYFILLFFWLLITHPQNRFPILGEIHFERIVMIISWIVLLLSRKINIKFSTLTFLISIFYLFLNISYLLSPYQDYHLSKHWIENYWKFIVLYFLILFSINDIKDIRNIFVGFVIILLLYQAHSWRDFLQGGSYIWRSGLKRLIGVWSSPEEGSANYFAMITLYSLPFALFWFKAIEKKKIKIMVIFYFIMSFFSIVYTGTRGALLALMFFILINVRNWKHFKIIILIFIIISGIATLSFPDYLKQRYFGLISGKQYGIHDRFIESQKGSAYARLKGLIDGWELAKKRPIFGYGPGSSPIARKQVNIDLLHEEESDSQLHSLYGQILAETGFLGTILFLLIIVTYFQKFRSIKNITETDLELSNYRLALQSSMLLLLFYGIASHTLYRYYWFLLFACQDAFFNIISKKFKAKFGQYKSK